jgi:hypothetical protein
VEATQKNTLVLGLGNLLLGDEGVGVHAARALLDEGFDGTWGHTNLWENPQTSELLRSQSGP